MANAYGLFWDSVSGDRLYNAASFEEWLKKFFTTGVFNGDLQVVESAGMAVTVGTGYCNVDGKVRFFDTNTNLSFATANGTYPRIDTVVIERNDTDREITMKVVTGTYSGNNPTATAPVRSGGIYQIVLAEVYISAGATAITQANITDKRADTSVCGWVVGTVDAVDVEQMTAQAQAEFLAWFDEMKDQLSEDAAGNLQLEIDGLTARLNALAADEVSYDSTTSGLSASNVQSAIDENSASITDLESAVTALNNSITTLNTSNYEAITVSSSFSGTGTIRILRLGKLRVLFGSVKPTNSGANQTILTLDSSDRPAINIQAPFSGYGVTGTGEMTVQSAGGFVISINAVPANDVKFNITYAVA